MELGETCPNGRWVRVVGTRRPEKSQARERKRESGKARIVGFAWSLLTDSTSSCHSLCPSFWPANVLFYCGRSLFFFTFNDKITGVNCKKKKG